MCNSVGFGVLTEDNVTYMVICSWAITQKSAYLLACNMYAQNVIALISVKEISLSENSNRDKSLMI